MIETALMPKPPSFLSEEELFTLLTDAKSMNKRMVSYRLTEEARRILEYEAERYGVNNTVALEILLREIREMRKKKR